MEKDRSHGWLYPNTYWINLLNINLDNPYGQTCLVKVISTPNINNAPSSKRLSGY